MRRMLQFSLVLLASFWFTQNHVWGGSIEGHWQGAVLYMEVDREVTVTFTKADDALKGSIDVPEAGLQGTSLSAVSFADPTVHFELPYGAGTVVFEGKLDGDSIAGGYEYEGYKGTFQLKRKQDTAGSPSGEE